VLKDKISFSGRTALVMGSGRLGMGGETCRALAELGARIVAVDITQERVDEISADVKQRGAECVGIVADLRDSAAIRDVVDVATKTFGDIHLLVNVVGGSKAGTWRPLEQYPDDVFDDVVALNLRAMFRASREVAAHMIRRKVDGRIVNFASTSGLASAPFHGAYGACKAGVMALTRTMAAEWGRYGLRANAVAPGLIATVRENAVEAPKIPINWNPLVRHATMGDVIGAVVFLLSDLSHGMTGQVLNVDAGASIRNPLGGAEFFEEYVSR
jgi:NAD(P)-dependent dehydrogenase (short-subunit alcohol dehydrogenase family)